jgi:hypothetical protein
MRINNMRSCSASCSGLKSGIAGRFLDSADSLPAIEVISAVVPRRRRSKREEGNQQDGRPVLAPSPLVLLQEDPSAGHIVPQVGLKKETGGREPFRPEEDLPRLLPGPGARAAGVVAAGAAAGFSRA